MIGRTLDNAFAQFSDVSPDGERLVISSDHIWVMGFMADEE